VSRTALLFAVVTLGAIRDPCGTDTTLVGLNAPCQRSTDCHKGLLCIAGTCEPPDGGKPGDDGGSPSDAQADDADGSAAD
jgi:hypothetical protein